MTATESLSIQRQGIRVAVSGELDIVSGPRMAQSFLKLATRSPVLELDLSEVTFMDACGLRALLWLKEAVPTVRVVALSPRVERVLVITNTYGTLVDTHLSDTG